MPIQFSEVFTHARKVALAMLDPNDSEDAKRKMMAYVNGHEHSDEIRELLITAARNGVFEATSLDESELADSVERGAVAIVYAAMETL